ncbi:bifunctional DNA-formamidopyrimidine glycosylase/DNA-(apurinic or apyrimidinic site) lyase [Polaromonas naphthalenivorans]|uniref:Formamidopyrimidine-DNA glycosylase n=1 Tax=Polaromonas naphthalenivorans (strain CJ2) TaxID=365044 RepID=FPG_POLNA|nr:bifunctional DNA-formamidopyrimidine glycosylase/DNA-(apurinic or apyrimidinic site) lyase [Polaromonas naphthalenivorans]A1VKP2.1 RecName: Full=Formamidopyrimidine-DNA glycosylase; Short=Fapy-DNA glycosylase; AltName: Full=DNA-(apurinic or apyrimidinic site) lyase MutM; Short=AP lyase MutM [Polaromonas naphthalenivorans CJ2]ABM36220.1 DNA-(apurinic or apyrimidinic site) lyase / Formamidopyrimidine-DNA glycosylase [Polaromonas naphthalenivorans CJ2]
MPELPEVEVTRLSFAERIAGARIEAVLVGKPLRWPLGCETQQLQGQRVLAVRRRGKYLLLDLSEGLLLMHLGMSGSVSFGLNLPVTGKHDHFDMVTSLGTLRLHDPRRFGAVVYASGEDDAVAKKLLGRLGVEPLSDAFDALVFHQWLKGRKTAIKPLLLAGQAVVGVGNIYASEALFLAGIRPTTKASLISKPRAARLHRAIQDVLTNAVAKGGSTLRDFSNADGEAGHFQLDAMVYDRAGLPCRVCAAPIKSIRQGQRSSFYCATCQKP